MKRYSPMEDPYVSLLPARLLLQLCLTHGRRGSAALPAALCRSHLRRNTAALGLSTAPAQAPLPCLGSLPPLAGGEEAPLCSGRGEVGCGIGKSGCPAQGGWVVPSSPSGLGRRGLWACFWGSDVLLAPCSLLSRR